MNPYAFRARKPLNKFPLSKVNELALFLRGRGYTRNEFKPERNKDYRHPVVCHLTLPTLQPILVSVHYVDKSKYEVEFLEETENRLYIEYLIKAAQLKFAFVSEVRRKGKSKVRFIMRNKA